MRIRLFDLLPEFLNRMVVGRRARQLKDRQARSVLGKEGWRGLARVLARAVLNQHQPLGRRFQHAPQERDIGRRVEAAFLPLIKEAPGEVVQQAEDLVPFAHAAGRDLGLLSFPTSGAGECPPRRKAGFVAKQQQGPKLARQPHRFGPGRATPLPALLLVQMRRHKSRFLPREAQVFEQLRQLQHAVANPKACQDQFRHERRTPTGRTEPGGLWPGLDQSRQFFFLRGGELRRTPGRFAARL